MCEKLSLNGNIPPFKGNVPQISANFRENSLLTEFLHQKPQKFHLKGNFCALSPKIGTLNAPKMPILRHILGILRRFSLTMSNRFKAKI